MGKNIFSIDFYLGEKDTSVYILFHHLFKDAKSYNLTSKIFFKSNKSIADIEKIIKNWEYFDAKYKFIIIDYTNKRIIPIGITEDDLLKELIKNFR